MTVIAFLVVFAIALVVGWKLSSANSVQWRDVGANNRDIAVCDAADMATDGAE